MKETTKQIYLALLHQKLIYVQLVSQTDKKEKKQNKADYMFIHDNCLHQDSFPKYLKLNQKTLNK